MKQDPITTNKANFACFQCRKSFKQRGSSSWDPEVPKRPFPCPECKETMVQMGRYFKAPTQRSQKQWLKIELLYHFGERFWAGNLGLGNKCRTLPNTVTYLCKTNRPKNEVESALDVIRNLRKQSS